MTRRRRPRRLALALGGLLGLAYPGLALPGCYDIPKPECGFRCGPDGACPEDYTCAPVDGRCHLNSAPPSLVCATPDGGIDAALE
jgi:hypothetical protein